MLVLTLTEGDYIEIGGDIRVYFDCKLNEDTLLVSIDAPQEDTVLRGKLYEAANPGRRNEGIAHKRSRRKAG